MNYNDEYIEIIHDVGENMLNYSLENKYYNEIHYLYLDYALPFNHGLFISSKR